MVTRDASIEKPQSIRFDGSQRRDRHPQAYYDEIKARFAAERDLRLAYRPPGSSLYTDAGPQYEVDPYADPPAPREQITDDVRCCSSGVASPPC